MTSAAETVENASIMSESAAHDGNRLWIGNIDPKITEYHLVKLLEKFGHVKQFDFLFHKSGPLEGQPRGYCFVNFNTREEAERAIQCLNGKLALSKKLVVRWAHAQVRVSRVLCWLVEMFGRWFFERNECRRCFLLFSCSLFILPHASGCDYELDAQSFSVTVYWSRHKQNQYFTLIMLMFWEEAGVGPPENGCQCLLGALMVCKCLVYRMFSFCTHYVALFL
ncbi:probable RNA-binding protein 18 isoform X1 [Pseudochaenichthys georgianus]|uniref:probable RNA-binding protein 18 isoform X1 n=1 Tax=Pseudochaenichthys georgianus TaxID=52239 RepID=UPI00146E5092|nr:probable RNA-binding protein 18 isoform X1 [Pseudochaenichthys georgianus]